MAKQDKLTARQQRFVVEFATTRNHKESAIAAGYSIKIASVMGSKLMKNPKIRDAVNKINKKDERKMELTREGVLRELANALYRDIVGLQDSKGFVTTDLNKVPKALRSVIDGFEVSQDLDRDGNVVGQKIKCKIMPKAQAVDMAMKHLGAYAVDKQEKKISFNWDDLYGPLPEQKGEA